MFRLKEFENKVFNNDCYEVLPFIESNSIDLILTDPPYNTTNCKWECDIDIQRLFEHFKRIIKSTGTIVVFGNNPFSARVIMNNLDIYKYSCVWVKPNSTSPNLAKKQPMRRYEDIMVFQKGCGTYNPVMSQGKPYKWKSKRSGGEATKISYKEDRSIENSGFRYPTNVFEFAQERGLHSTQKPVPLFEYIIKMYTNEGDIVFDPFSGSGTSAIASIKSQRKFICIEKDKDIFEKSVKRIENIDST